MSLSGEYEGNKIWPFTITWNWFKYKRFGNGEYGETLQEWLKYQKIKIPYFIILQFVKIEWRLFYNEYGA